ncbi:hypothetical protein RHMOL_Rhmol06G0156300 [Rhododendron molle]|uniref:Uncharacterized protein n=1 Tax=Rhododendron molle TaxID=49168 RepID=A0ACC0NCU5_RHOML|nr:hypothetical protein RHMOL_Rhmol06G0156300 [Rhododendron molle]
MANPRFMVGMEFKTHEVLRDAIKEHSIKMGKMIKFKKYDRQKVKAVCQKGCPWEIYGSYVPSDALFRVKKYKSVHECSRSFHVPWVSMHLILKKYSERIKGNPTWLVKSLAQTIEKEQMVKVSIQKVHRARRMALEELQGSAEEQFKQLWGYVEEGPHGGILLTAVAIDANNCIYPFAYAVVEKEKFKTWNWRWDLSGIPCIHAIAALNCLNLDIYDYVHECYKVDTYLSTYNHLVNPINGRDMWPITDNPILLPPDVQKRVGRPKKARRKEPEEPEPADPTKLGRKDIKMT